MLEMQSKQKEDSMKSILKGIAFGALLAFALSLTIGCMGVDKYTARTTVHYKAPGVEADYDSNKNQENFKAKVGFDAQGKINALDIETTATTPEAAIAAALQSNAQILKSVNDLLNTVLPLIKTAATKGAL
jgi:hypothetical protein